VAAEAQKDFLEWLENTLEDEQEMTREFKATIGRGFAQIAAGQGRVRKT
jgi:hypothetical protein